MREGDKMKELFTSASKVVFILIALSACAALFTEHLKSTDFMALATAAFAFYFSSKGDLEKPYGGK